jgi:hypothetical protein
MKVRIADQRIVFRLNDDARNRLLVDKSIYSRLDFGNSRLTFQITLAKEGAKLQLHFEKNEVNVLIPEAYMDQWDAVKLGFEEVIVSPEGKEMTLIIEKDLKRTKRKSVDSGQ